MSTLPRPERESRAATRASSLAVRRGVPRDSRASAATGHATASDRRRSNEDADGAIDCQVVSDRDDFQVPRGARLDDKSQRVEQRDDDGRHDCRLSENARNLNQRNTYEVLSCGPQKLEPMVPAGGDESPFDPVVGQHAIELPDITGW